jgi:hypothetical protein
MRNAYGTTLLISQLSRLERFALRYQFQARLYPRGRYLNEPNSEVTKALIRQFLDPTVQDRKKHHFSLLRHVQCCTEASIDDHVWRLDSHPDYVTRGTYSVFDNLAMILSFLYLPLLETAVFFTGPVEHKVFAWPSPTPPCASALKSLTLHNCEMGMRSLGEVLRVTPNLEYLLYDFYGDVGPSAYFTLPAQGYNTHLHEALCHLRRTIKELVVKYHFWSEESWPRFSNGFDPIGSFQKFHQLERLSLPSALLLGWTPNAAPQLADILPPTLQSLALRDDLVLAHGYPWSDLALLRVLRDFVPRRHAVPALRTLVFPVLPWPLEM